LFISERRTYIVWVFSFQTDSGVDAIIALEAPKIGILITKLPVPDKMETGVGEQVARRNGRTQLLYPCTVIIVNI
jgi:hypothetical protein